MQHTTRHSVLLVEANPSLRRMIVLGLQHRGLHVIEAGSLASFPVSPHLLPDLIVLDIDGEAGNDHMLLAQAQAHPALSDLPVVALAWEPPIHEETRDLQAMPVVQPLICLAKPFDARALHAAIDALLRGSEEASAVRKQESYLAAQRATISAPSIWPLVTALGLLLAVIGLMLQITVTAVGILVVVTALMCWTLGAKPEPETLVV